MTYSYMFAAVLVVLVLTVAADDDFSAADAVEAAGNVIRASKDIYNDVAPRVQIEDGGSSFIWVPIVGAIGGLIVLILLCCCICRLCCGCCRKDTVISNTTVVAQSTVTPSAAPTVVVAQGFQPAMWQQQPDPGYTNYTYNPNQEWSHPMELRRDQQGAQQTTPPPYYAK